MLKATVKRMANSEEVTFEVLVLIGSRWETQGVYKSNEQNVAMAEAKSLEKVSIIKAVKVVKEFYDDKSQTTRSLKIFEMTSKVQAAPEAAPMRKEAKRKPVAKARTKGASGKGKKKRKVTGASPSEDMVSAATAEETAQKRPSFLSAFLQFILSLVAAAIAAIAVTQIANMAMRDMRSIGFLGRNDFLIVVFILVFAVTTLALVTRILTKLKRIGPSFSSRQRTGATRQAEAQAAAAMAAPAGFQPTQPTEEQVELHASLHAGLQSLPGGAKPGVPVYVPPDAAENSGFDEDDLPSLSEPEVVVPEEIEVRQPDDLLSELLTMNTFTGEVLDTLKGGKGMHDAHTVFGMVLFLVGAGQALRTQRQLTDDTYNTVIYKTLGGLGLTKERAERFVEHTDEYLISDARYSQMFQAGRSAMTTNLESNVGPRGALADVLSDWDKPKSKVDSGQPVTVLFTDIAGSTAMTQKMGDEGAQKVVRVHNTIVRDAIKTFTGKEVKHTGDGIMASFPSAPLGVEAAQDMQKKTLSHNKSNPELSLDLKIGLNAGDPIAEDDDLFGSTVQLAARIVDKAAPGQILVSGSVQGLSQGKNLKFERFADVDMKGFDEPVTVYTALWDGYSPPPVEVAAEPEPEPAPEPEETPVPKESPNPEAKAVASPKDGKKDEAKPEPEAPKADVKVAIKKPDAETPDEETKAAPPSKKPDDAAEA